MPAIPTNKLHIPAKRFQINFRWQGDSVNSVWEPYSALLVPVKLENCPRQFYMQFDLGSPYSMFYRNKLKAIQSKYPKALNLADSTTALKNYTFKVGKMPVAAKEITVREFGNNPINWSDEKEIEVIGTMGTDLIDGRVILIDYPQKEMTISPDAPSNLTQGMELADFVYVNRSVLLPAVIKGKKTILFFDTGSSAYELLTDKKTFAILAIPGMTQAQYPVKSWDRIWTANTVASNDSVEIASQKLPIKRVTYIEGVSNSQIEQMMKMGIGGMTGNKLFIENSLLLDTKNKKFGIGKGKGN